MVGASDLAFRLLTRRYGATLCYTPMFYADRFVSDAAYRQRAFQTTAADRPLVVQFCADDAAIFTEAARMVAGRCDAVELNLGCPQREARRLHYGSYLLGNEDRALILRIVQHAASALSVPLLVKTRLLDSLDETVTLAKQLEEAGW
jgi:tRNA-dihydrouridine synthase 1